VAAAIICAAAGATPSRQQATAAAASRGAKLLWGHLFDAVMILGDAGC